MFIAALFIIGKIWKQPKCPKDEWLRKMVCVCVHTYTYTVTVVVIYSLSHVQLCNSMHCNLSESAVHGISQARTLEWAANSFSRDLPEPGIKPASPALAGGFFTTKLPGKPTMEYYTTIKRIKLCHLQQHEWTWSEVSQTETNTV